MAGTKAEGHPRTYGATAPPASPIIRVAGSSPHLRGNPTALVERPLGYGVIPAPTGQPRCSKMEDELMTGHPRTYGATPLHPNNFLLGFGSSPHLRGNPKLSPGLPNPLRVIPAPTGQPLDCRALPTMLEGHPRTYGATVTVCVAPWVTSGSSPHLRGNRDKKRRWGSGRGVIPAPTGQPALTGAMLCPVAGHPRTYGATTRWCGSDRPVQGSSPHLRGNHRQHHACCDKGRVIPAPTGQPLG